ncbi:MAG: Uncharacterized protein G01um101413_699 [Parcubacteria group bacterium Gr01-1014_13]|nr:MAG: Uncharacterized protein G01um101413_699 [Parcubacteria group bacterium Gr01-1014_13]
MEDEIIRKIKEIIASDKTLTESQVAHLMVLMRKLIDKTKAENFQLLDFFCNWSVHTDMDRTPALEILKRLNDLIVTTKDYGNTNLIIALVSAVISFKELRQEIKKLLSSAGIQTDSFDNISFWRNFAQKLIEILRDCPLQMPEDPGKKSEKIIKQIEANQIKAGCWIKQVSIKVGPTPILGQTIYLNILYSDTTIIALPFLFE